MQDEDKKIEKRIREAAAGQAPEVWDRIERRIRQMDNKPQTNRWKLPVIISSAACLVAAVVLVSVFAFGRPNPGPIAINPSPIVTAPSSATPSTQPSASPVGTSAAAQVRTPVPFSTGTALQPVQGPNMDIRFYETLKEMVSYRDCTDVVYLKYKKELGAKAAAWDKNRLYTYYEMEVVKSFKGGLKVGDTVEVKTTGGANENVWIEDNFVERFTRDFDYVLFLNALNEDGRDLYQLVSPLQGYVPVQGGQVSLNTRIESNGLFKQGEDVEALFSRIEDAVK